jgi:hypothetical protein
MECSVLFPRLASITEHSQGLADNPQPLERYRPLVSYMREEVRIGVVVSNPW